MKKTATVVVASAVAAAGMGMASASAARADFDVEREKSVRCSAGAFASLSLEKEFNRIDVDFEVENAPAARSWNVRIKQDGRTVLRTKRIADYEGDLDVTQQVRDRAGKDRFVARASGPDGQVCRVVLSI